MKKYAESKGFFDFKAERELYSIVKAWGECSSQRRERILLPENCKNRKSIQKKEPTIVLNNNSGFFFRKRFSFTLLFDIFFCIQKGKARFVS